MSVVASTTNTFALYGMIHYKKFILVANDNQLLISIVILVNQNKSINFNCESAYLCQGMKLEVNKKICIFCFCIDSDLDLSQNLMGSKLDKSHFL